MSRKVICNKRKKQVWKKRTCSIWPKFWGSSFAPKFYEIAHKCRCSTRVAHYSHTTCTYAPSECHCIQVSFAEMWQAVLPKATVTVHFLACAISCGSLALLQTIEKRSLEQQFAVRKVWNHFVPWGKLKGPLKSKNTFAVSGTPKFRCKSLKDANIETNDSGPILTHAAILLSKWSDILLVAADTQH